MKKFHLFYQENELMDVESLDNGSYDVELVFCITLYLFVSLRVLINNITDGLREC